MPDLKGIELGGPFRPSPPLIILGAKELRAHGWRSAGNWGNYGVYGWKWGIWRVSAIVADGYKETAAILALGPWRVMFDKVEKLNATV